MILLKKLFIEKKQDDIDLIQAVVSVTLGTLVGGID